MSYIEGLDDVIRKLENIKNVDKKKIALRAGQVWERYAKQYAPVKSGDLRRSGNTEETDYGADLVFSVSYALYQERGNSKMPGKFFCKRSLADHKAQIIQAAQDTLNEEVEGK